MKNSLVIFALATTSMLSADQYYQYQPQGSCPGGNCPAQGYNQGYYNQGYSQGYNQSPGYNYNTQYNQTPGYNYNTPQYHQTPGYNYNTPQYNTPQYNKNPGYTAPQYYNQTPDSNAPVHGQPTSKNQQWQEGQVSYNGTSGSSSGSSYGGSSYGGSSPSPAPSTSGSSSMYDPVRQKSDPYINGMDDRTGLNPSSNDTYKSGFNPEEKSNSTYPNPSRSGSTYRTTPSSSNPNMYNQNMNNPNMNPGTSGNTYMNPNSPRYNDSSYDNKPGVTVNTKYQNDLKSIPDQDIAKKVHDVLSGWFTTNYPNVTFDVNHGVVSLRGTVETVDDKRNIEEDVRKIEGVRQVDSQITVTGDKDSYDNSKTKNNYNNTNRATSAENERTRNQYNENKFPQDFGATDTDRQLNTKIRNKISNNWFSKNYESVILRTTNGVVIISGPVDDFEDVQRITDTVKKVEGVKSINNQMSVKSK